MKISIFESYFFYIHITQNPNNTIRIAREIAPVIKNFTNAINIPMIIIEHNKPSINNHGSNIK